MSLMLLAATNSENLWTPYQLQTELWLDASDITTVTRVSNVVSQWNDKSGRGRNATQTTAANRPGYGTVLLNGRAMVNFDGSNDSLILPTGVYTESPCIWIVSDCNTNSAPLLRLQNTSEVLFLVNSSGAYPRLIATRRGETQISVEIPDYRYHILNADSGSSSGITWTYYVNGSAGANQTNQGTATGTANTNVIGINENSTNPYLGSIGEIIVASGGVPTGTRQIVEGYLAHKWGLTLNLPSDHPYKINPPLST